MSSFETGNGSADKVHNTQESERQRWDLTLIETASLMRAITEERDRFFDAVKQPDCPLVGETEHLVVDRR